MATSDPFTMYSSALAHMMGHHQGLVSAAGGGDPRVQNSCHLRVIRLVLKPEQIPKGIDNDDIFRPTEGTLEEQFRFRAQTEDDTQLPPFPVESG